MKHFGLMIAAFVLSFSKTAQAAGDPHHSDAHHDGGGVGLPQFDPSSFPSQVFWLVVTFSVLYIFFSKKTLPDISGVIENRKTHIQSDLDSAEKLRSEAEEVHAAYDEALDEARQKAVTYYQKASEKIQKNAAAQNQAFQEKSTSEIATLESEIESAKADIMDDMSAIAAEIASEAAEKIIGVPADLNAAKDVVQSIHKKKAA